MAIRIDTDLQAVYVYEPDGHTVPALNTALSAGGRLRIEETEGLDSLVCGFFGDLAATNYWGLFANASGTDVQLRGRQSGTTTTSGNYALPPGEYNLSIEHDAGTLRARLDGVVILSMAYAPAAGTLGDRSFQIGGYGEISGFIDCTIARWRMWSGVLTEAEWRREFRSTVPARTRGLLHDWPMEAGSGRFNDTVGSEPDLLDNPLVPCGGGSEIYLRATLIGAPQFFDLGQTATPGALSVNVPRWADRVVVHVAWSSNSVATFNVASISGNFCGTFVATENEDNLSTSVGVAVFHAEVTINGTGRSLTIALDAGSTLAGANCWVTFMQDVDRGTPVSAMDTGHAGAGGTVPGTSSVAIVAPAMVVALDARLSTTSGGYATNETGWTSIGTNETTGAIGYWLCSRLRELAADSGPVSATTQDTFASAIVSIAFRSAAMATVAPTAPLPVESNVVESGNNTASTSWAVSHPAAVAGDMMLFHLAWDDSTDTTSVTPPTGPNGETATSIAGPIASNGTEVRAQAWRYIATGSWSASTRTFTPSASEQWTAAVLKIPAGEFDSSTPIGAASTRASAGTAETAVLSPAYSVGSTDGGGRLVTWLAVDDDPFTGFAQPWSTHSNVDRGVVAGLLASRDIETSNSESVAAGTWNIAGDSWASLAYVVRKPSSGTSPTLTTSLSMAVQLARSASASLATAVQVPQQATTSVSLAVAAARTATASVAAAIQQAQAATALVQVAIQAPQSAGTSVATAVQAARTAAADLALAVQEAKNSGVGVDLQVQAPSQVSTAVSLQVQAGASASASVQVAVQALAQASTALSIALSQAQTADTSISAGVQVARTGGASAGLAIQAGRTAAVGVDLQIQEGSTRALALQAAVQFAASASTALSVAVAQLQTAGVGLAAAISLQNTLGFAVEVAVFHSRNPALGLSLFVDDPTVVIEIDPRFVAKPTPPQLGCKELTQELGGKMSSKIGPIQTREKKPATFDFSDEGVSGVLSDPQVTISVESGEDPDPASVLVGDPQVQGDLVIQSVKYQKADVMYLLQCTATDSLGHDHTVSAYLMARAVCERMAWSKESRHARGYGAAWVRLRKAILERDGHICQCPECLGGKKRIASATEVDHIKPKAQGGTDDETNLRAVNSECHERITKEQKGIKPKRQIGADGWPK